ncbi:hypothetical protein N7533_003590 [Penicillium manginii]|uniref:uncharacterized protein n=1 Tax=Penicillium manginii TaxID=203109 RepID=UPI002546A680|nr:uncharacterized protein N7533_003590 [Penicillium manginii]KAJ5761551.1 hypothetical protein N7533_003590 [Penicillium manginii]
MTEAQVDQTQYQIWVATGRKQLSVDPIHRLIIMNHPRAEKCVWFHCEGWSGYWIPRIEPDMPLQNYWVESKIFVANIPASAGPTIEKEARKIPDQNSGLWVAYLLLRLQGEGLLPKGTYEKWREKLEDPEIDVDLGPNRVL